VLVRLGADVFAQDAQRRTSLHCAELKGNDEVVSFLRSNAILMRRSKSTTVVPVVDPAAQAAAEVAAAAMAALLIAEEEDQKQAPASKQGNSNKARARRNRRKANLDELLGTSSKGLNGALSGSVDSSSGRRDNVGEDTARHAARHCQPNGEIGAYGAEESVGLASNNDGQNLNESESSISSNVQRAKAIGVECEAGTSHNGAVRAADDHASGASATKREGAEEAATATENHGHSGRGA
jgi:ankyrin repeat protein